jgi:hypothetical protein
MKDVQPIKSTTVRPLRVLGAIAVGTVLLGGLAIVIHEGGHRYQLLRAGGIWCATLEPDGTITKSFGAENCGY